MDILKEIEEYYSNFKGDKGVIGYSVNGKPLYRFTVVKTEFPKIIVQCAIHAREYITSHLCLKLIDYFSAYGKTGTVCFIPAMNPDGIEIALREKPLYKANHSGVDLNVNFDARWGCGAKNVHTAGDENYIGEHPFSEPESIALKDFTLSFRPDFTLSYHSKGEEIYWEFNQRGKRRKRDLFIAQAAAGVTGYPLKSTPDSCGGYKDWCIEKLKIPAITVEVGNDDLSHPIGVEYVDEIFDKNKNMLFAVIGRLTELKCKINL